MPLILIKTDQGEEIDETISREFTEKIIEVLGVTTDDIAIKFEESKKRVVDLYMYGAKQRNGQKERTPEVFKELIKSLDEIINNGQKKKFRVILHIIKKERCFRAGKSRF